MMRSSPLRFSRSRVLEFTILGGLAFSALPTATLYAQWVPNYQNYSIQRVGLFGPQHTLSDGYQVSYALFLSAPSFVAGTSDRYSGVADYNGQNAWAFNGTTTTLIGLTSATYTSSAGYQYSRAELQNAAGQVAGYSERYLGVTDNGRDAWVWNGTTTTQVGLTGAGYTGSAGYRASSPLLLNATGQVVGTSIRYDGLNRQIGQDAWAWNGTTTTQIGLTGPAYFGSRGRQVSLPQFQNVAGQVVGYSERFAGAMYQGQDAWAWNGESTTQIGLTGPGYTGLAGYQRSSAQFQNAAGQVAGYSQRITDFDTVNGQIAWAWNGTTTTQVGLTGAAYTGSAGFQYSELRLQNVAGQLAGYSERITGVSTSNGRNAWAWNGTTTAEIGLAGGANTGNMGYQDSRPQFQNAAGQVAGFSYRLTGVDTENGRNAWVWNGTSTTQIGLTGEANTGSGGRQYSEPAFQNIAGQLAGFSDRITGVNTPNGRDSWAWNGTITTQIGLTGGANTGSAGYQYSEPLFQNAAGQVAGYSQRINDVSTVDGQSAWYFDPITLRTSAVSGSIRTSDNFASSTPTTLTEDGFLLGYYTFFAGGVGDGEQRAFIFRPDLGFTDLGNLVSGGLTLNGWRTLQNPLFSDALNTIVGHGSVNGQTSGQSVFVMVAASVPTCVADVAGGVSGGPDGVVDGNDFIAFINAFGAGDVLADVAGGPTGGPDGIIDGNDFIAFINAFGAGC